MDQQFINIDEVDIQFYFVVKRQNPFLSARLNFTTQHNVNFCIDRVLQYTENEKNKKWLVQDFEDGARIKSVQSGGYLKINWENGEFKNLSCVHFDQNHKDEFIWKIDIVPKFRAFRVESKTHGKDGTSFNLTQLISSKHKHETDQLRLLILPEQIFTMLKQESDLTPQAKTIPANKSANVNDCSQTPLNFKGSSTHFGDSLFRVYAHQYATSSYKIENMTPCSIFYPKDAEDIQVILKFAQQTKKRVTVRSGGHQYSGKSSGNLSTVVIDMSHFNSISERGKNLLDVKPGLRLKDLSKNLQRRGYSIPHGQCPLVCIGGHGQTGGYGNLLRSFGLNGDYIQGFEIVTADGNIHNVVRPGSTLLATSQEEQFNNQLFTGVLSGNAGSFGVITNYTYKFIRDEDHPNSYGYEGARTYNKDVFKRLLQEFQRLSVLTGKKEDYNHNLKGCDYFLTVGSNNLPRWVNTKTSLMLLQLLYADLDNKPYEDQFKGLIDTYKGERTHVDGLIEGFYPGFNSKTKVSHIARNSVKKFPLIINGRQFLRPYKKRVNITNQPITNQFIDKFVDIVTDILENTTLKLISQLQVGGGQYCRKGKQLQSKGFVTYPHRELLLSFAFDLFYVPGSAQSEKQAIHYQDKMQALIDEHFSKGQELRMFWGSFGDTDISKQEIRSKYYDSEEQYAKLQELKAKVDPNDLFHTEFTVKLPKK